MNKGLGAIALVTLLSCLSVTTLGSDRLWAQEASDSRAEAGRLLNQGLQQYRNNQTQAAFQTWQKTLQIYREIKDRAGEGKVLNNFGIAYYMLGQYDKSVNFFQQRLAIARELNDRKGEANALDSLGLNYILLGQYEKAIAIYQQAVAIFQELNDRQNEGNAVGNLGIAYRELGKYQKAINFHQQQLTITREIKDRAGEGRALGGLGIVYRELGQYQKAITFYEQDLAIAREFKDLNGQGRAFNNLGIAYGDLLKYKEAVTFYQQALEIFRDIENRKEEGSTLGNLGIAYRELGQYQKALTFHQQQLAIAYAIKDRVTEGKAVGGLGIIYNKLRQYDKALPFYLRDLAIALELGDRRGEGRVFNNLGVIFADLDQTTLSILAYKQSVNIQESIRKDLRGLSKEEQKSFLDTVARTYRHLASLLLMQGRVIEALQVLDLLKVQELEDYLKNVKGNDRTAQGVKLLEPETVTARQLSLLKLEDSAEINLQLANQIRQIPRSELNKIPDYLQQIPQGTVLLYPLILSDRLELILFSPNSPPLNHTVKISQKELKDLINNYRTGLLDTTSEDYKAAAVALYNLLIKPIEAELIRSKAKTILYAPDGQMRYVPLAALYDGKKWLIEKYQISNLIAYSLSDFSPKPKTQPNILAGAFGGKAGEKRFGQLGLPATLKEVQAIANSFQNSVTLTEDQFSRQALESKFKNHNILHLASHAEFNTGAPDNSFIIFGNGDKIRLNEISDWQIPNIDLVILSACQTGVGKLGDGVEVLGFGYQVQKAGAKQAIASLWKVDDAGTQVLMEAFYQELKKGNITSTEALQRAQISLIKSPNYNHPNYWSAFFAIGNGL
ncbi:CHAT domain-containing protein [Phormidium tenue]|uniref:Tetratricopeptide repeat protein n=1 Tax=Phormidium tenue FACHB-1050 TaxID=2692857 RepID=A0ABR8C6J5_9CYAN|nr:CHAT domain-containing protein [Phormidium tenue]MBD2316060.1 tetratricopeptide repeat protein [Phormidium tenue FACHB-1050]